MSTTSLSLIAGTAVLILGGAIFLMTWVEPPPVQTVETTIPDERLSR